MNELALFHKPESNYCFVLSRNEIALRLRVKKGEKFTRVEVIYACKYDFSEKRFIQQMQKKFSDNLYDYYTVKLKLNDVRLAYIFRLVEKGRSYFYSESGLSDYYDFNLGYYNFFQVAYINENDLHYEVEWLKSAVFYQIFIDRFCRGDKDKDDKYISMKWGDKPSPKNFAGGDIKGIIKKLDYIKDLGINALYLTPIFKSRSNHKYDISDYKNVDPQFGSNQDVKELVKLSHENGIKVVMDAVFNHCSEDLSQFQDVLKYGKDSEFFDWFIVHGDYINDEMDNYECFASCKYMPKFNTSNERLQEFLIDIAIYWIKEYDIDGWRLDVSDEVSHDFWRKFRKAVKRLQLNAVIIGENWHDANSYLMGDQYDSIMNYAFTKACLDYFAFNNFNAKIFSERLSTLLMRNTDQVNSMMLNLLDSHDTERFLTRLNGNTDRFLAAICVAILFMGATSIYYGTEIPLTGGYDPDCRKCFDWENSKSDMREKIKQLIELKQLDEVKQGDISLQEKRGMFILERSYKAERIRLYVNLTEEPKKIEKHNDVIAQNNFNELLQKDGFVLVRL